MSMLNTFSAKTYNRIRNTTGNTFMENTNVLKSPQQLPRKTHLQSTNDILSAGYSFKKFTHDAAKGIKEINHAIPDSVKNEIKTQAISAAKNYLLPAAEEAAADAVPLLLAAGRKKGVQPVALKKWVEHVKAYQKKHGCTYKEAMIKSKSSYKKK